MLKTVVIVIDIDDDADDDDENYQLATYSDNTIKIKL